MKTYYIQYNIGKVKYVVNHSDETKFYPDESEFFDVALFKNKKKLNQFVKNLQDQNYIER